MNASTSPVRVSIGMPVFNGAATLNSALASVLRQTFRELEIIISDNASTDETPQICKAAAARDPRIRYVRQPAAISPTENFNFVLREAKSPYFMWAAHDDTRDPEFVEKLLRALEANPSAILAFGDVVELLPGEMRKVPLRFVNANLSPAQRLRLAAFNQLHNLYGLWCTEALRRVPWQHVDWWHDTPPMMAASLLGEFIHVPGVTFYYKYNARPFFGWKRISGFSGLLLDVQEFRLRTSYLFRLVWLCYSTVGRTAGPWYGLLAGWYAALKVLHQISSFIARRLLPTLRN